MTEHITHITKTLINPDLPHALAHNGTLGTVNGSLRFKTANGNYDFGLSIGAEIPDKTKLTIVDPLVLPETNGRTSSQANGIADPTKELFERAKALGLILPDRPKIVTTQEVEKNGLHTSDPPTQNFASPLNTEETEERERELAPFRNFFLGYPEPEEIGIRQKDEGIRWALQLQVPAFLSQENPGKTEWRTSMDQGVPKSPGRYDEIPSGILKKEKEQVQPQNVLLALIRVGNRAIPDIPVARRLNVQEFGAVEYLERPVPFKRDQKSWGFAGEARIYGYHTMLRGRAQPEFAHFEFKDFFPSFLEVVIISSTKEHVQRYLRWTIARGYANGRKTWDEDGICRACGQGPDGQGAFCYVCGKGIIIPKEPHRGLGTPSHLYPFGAPVVEDVDFVGVRGFHPIVIFRVAMLPNSQLNALKENLIALSSNH